MASAALAAKRNLLAAQSKLLYLDTVRSLCRKSGGGAFLLNAGSRVRIRRFCPVCLSRRIGRQAADGEASQLSGRPMSTGGGWHHHSRRPDPLYWPSAALTGKGRTMSAMAACFNLWRDAARHFAGPIGIRPRRDGRLSRRQGPALRPVGGSWSVVQGMGRRGGPDAIRASRQVGSAANVPPAAVAEKCGIG